MANKFVAVFLLLAAWDGHRKGFIKKLVGIVSLALTLILTSIASPFVAEFLKSYTGIYSTLQNSISASDAELLDTLQALGLEDAVSGYLADQILQALVATASGSGGKWNDRTGYGEVDPAALLASDPSRYPDENPFEEKQGDSVVTPDDIDDYDDGLVNPSSVYNDDTYVYRGLDEQVVTSGASGYPAHLGTSPRYHAQ